MLDYILGLDKELFTLINSVWTAPWADKLFPAVTDLHKEQWFQWAIVPLLLVIYSFLRGTRKAVLIVLMTFICVGLSDGIGNWGLKKNIQRLRPGDTPQLEAVIRAPYGGYSFVSNHSTNMFSIAMFTSLVFPMATLPLFFLASVIAYSRVYNGVHFPTDVLCGAFIGLIVGYLVFRLYALILKKYHSRLL